MQGITASGKRVRIVWYWQVAGGIGLGGKIKVERGVIMKKEIRVAAVQASTVFLDLDATIEKGCKLIAEAAENGADLIVFPEAYFPGYPYFIWLDQPGWQMPFWKRFYENTFEVPGPEMAKLAKAARDNNIFVCASGTERDGGSLYLTQVWFDRSGNIMGKHRKVQPTGVERTVWGHGDGSMMQVYDTEIGRLGGLQCWEHLMPTNPLIMDSMNEQIHAASWPAFAWDPNSVHYVDTPNAATKYYSVVTGTFCVLATETLSQDAIDQMCGDRDELREIYKPGYACGAKVLNPSGKQISKEEFAHDEEGIAYADCDLSEIALAKYHMDCAGHYSNTGVARVIFDNSPKPVVTALAGQTDYSMTYEDLQTAQ